MKMTDTVIIQTQSFLNYSAMNIVLKHLKIQGSLIGRKEKCEFLLLMLVGTALV